MNQTLKTSKQDLKVMEGEKTMEEAQVLEPQNASLSLIKGFQLVRMDNAPSTKENKSMQGN